VEKDSQIEVKFVAPRTHNEEILVTIWQEVLNLEKVGVHDNFFDLGGHSLLATQVVSRIQEALALEFSLQNIFASPTVAELAKLLDLQQLGQADDQVLEEALAEIDLLSDEEMKLLMKE
jgi:acyl carrier protein